MVSLTIEISEQLEKFWKIEERGNETREQEESFEIKLIEETFEKTYSKNKHGRFMVDILAKHGIEKLNGSFGRALNTLKHTERHSLFEKKVAYQEFMNEYESLRHMRKLNVKELNLSPSYYIRHHIISRPTSKYNY